ncbi:MAG TPA: Fic family protein [Vicinamibacterales bacterium]|nr:Fic family protein [Vicinamibacterales bacterium]
MLFQTPGIDDQDEAVVARIEEIRAQLSYAVHSRRWTGSLRRLAFAKAVRGSNSIEGYRVSVDDALAAVDEEPPMEAAEATWQEVVGYRTAMTYVLQLANDPHFGFSRGLIRSLHYMMLNHHPTRNPGRWRPGPIYVRNQETNETVYEGPPAEYVNEWMHELVSELNQEKHHVLVRAAMAHLNLVMIHPFSDGNGRMGRCIQTLVLARGQILDPQFCSIEEYLGYKQQDYYNVLAEVGQGAWHPERDARPWIRFCLTAHYRQANNLVRWSRIYQRLWEQIEQETGRLGLPERAVGALCDAALGHKQRNATYRKTADVTLVIAGRDLRAAADAGLLVPGGEKRGRYYIASDDLRNFGRRAYEPFTEQDPFEIAHTYLPGLAPP